MELPIFKIIVKPLKRPLHMTDVPYSNNDLDQIVQNLPAESMPEYSAGFFFFSLLWVAT